MCGRFTLRTPIRVLAELFDIDDLPALDPRFNVAPTQTVATVRRKPGEGRNELALLRWGLVPSWADDPRIGNRLINARAESAAGKPSFRSAFRHRRCLVPADGFYEWKASGKHKDPYYIGLRDGRPFAFAGLWEFWKGPDGEVIESCTLLTTEANDVVRPIHDRMPVILAPADYRRWLDPAPRDPGTLLPLLRPYPPEEMTSFAVSRWVNDPRHDDPACVQPQA